jgi:gamma-glutamylcyclotransferase (GGCT)/AIG2-like uncharacterized protein YtfP
MGGRRMTLPTDVRIADPNATIKPILRDGIVEHFDIQSPDQPVPVFVYGTLRSQGWNNGCLGPGAVFLSSAYLESRNYRLTARFPSVPVLFPYKSDNGRVEGQLWEIPYQNLTNVDNLEGVYDGKQGGMYQRCLTGVIPRNSKSVVDAIVYASLDIDWDKRFRLYVDETVASQPFCDWYTGTRWEEHPMYEYEGQFKDWIQQSAQIEIERRRRLLKELQHEEV